MQPPAGSQVSRVPAQRTPPEQLAPPRAGAGAAAAPPPAAHRAHRGRRGCSRCSASAAVVTGYVLYDRATAPDRSAPDVVVANYMQAFLVDRNDTRASDLRLRGRWRSRRVCASLRDDLVAREQRFGTTIVGQLGQPRVSEQQGDTAQRPGRPRSSPPSWTGSSQSDRQGWQFRDPAWRRAGGSASGSTTVLILTRSRAGGPGPPGWSGPGRARPSGTTPAPG